MRYRWVAYENGYHLTPVEPPPVRVVVVDTEDGPMHVGQCTICGCMDPENNPIHQSHEPQKENP